MRNTAKERRDQKSAVRGNAKDQDTDTDRSLFTRIAEGAIVFAICCFLVRLGVEYVLAVKVPLMIIALIVGIIVVAFRVTKRGRHDDY